MVYHKHRNMNFFEICKNVMVSKHICLSLFVEGLRCREQQGLRKWSRHFFIKQEHPIWIVATLHLTWRYFSKILRADRLPDLQADLPVHPQKTSRNMARKIVPGDALPPIPNAGDEIPCDDGGTLYSPPENLNNAVELPHWPHTSESRATGNSIDHCLHSLRRLMP